MANVVSVLSLALAKTVVSNYYNALFQSFKTLSLKLGWLVFIGVNSMLPEKCLNNCVILFGLEQSILCFVLLLISLHMIYSHIICDKWFVLLWSPHYLSFYTPITCFHNYMYFHELVFFFDAARLCVVCLFMADCYNELISHLGCTWTNLLFYAKIYG